MNRTALYTMLEKERMVYIKPCRGSLGIGVIRVERCVPNVREGSSRPRKGQTHYRAQAGRKVQHHTSYDKLYKALLKETGGKPYLVQKGIWLSTYRGRIFDIRVMVQHNPRGKWEVTGVVGRVAHPRKVVTNGSQGGTIYPIERLLGPRLTRHKRKAVMAKIEKIGMHAARRLGRTFPRLREIGADIAIDRGRRLWILEVNTRPDPCPFTKLKDRSKLRRIVRYGQAYGRTYDLKCTKSKQGIV